MGDKKSILVLGGNGFIGRHVVAEFVATGHDVRVFDRPRQNRMLEPWMQSGVEWHTGDFLNKADLLRALEGISTVVHLISMTVPQNSFENPVHDVETNLIGTLRLLAAMKEKGVRRILYISSGGAVYGSPVYLPIDENHPTNPIVPYGICKLAIEKYLLMYAHTEELQAICLRVSNPYGPGQRIEKAQGVLTALLHKTLSGLPLEIWGNGEVRRDFLYVQDVAKAFVLAFQYLENGGSKRIFNIGAGQSWSINQLLKIIYEVTGREPNVTREPSRCFDTPENILSPALARAEFGWEPQISIRQGMEQTINWLANYQVTD
jgi:UDP-glucose 4-epimerase